MVAQPLTADEDEEKERLRKQVSTPHRTLDCWAFPPRILRGTPDCFTMLTMPSPCFRWHAAFARASRNGRGVTFRLW